MCAIKLFDMPLLSWTDGRLSSEHDEQKTIPFDFRVMLFTFWEDSFCEVEFWVYKSL